MAMLLIRGEGETTDGAFTSGGMGGMRGGWCTKGGGMFGWSGAGVGEAKLRHKNRQTARF